MDYGQIGKELSLSKAVICENMTRYKLQKKWNIKRGAKKGCMPKNIATLHIKGNKNPKWKKNVSYPALHTWINDRRGKPKKCSHCGSTGKKAYDWANISGEYKRNITDWIRLCRGCHIKYDRGQK